MTDQPMPAEAATELGHKHKLRCDPAVEMLGGLLIALVTVGAIAAIACFF